MNDYLKQKAEIKTIKKRSVTLKSKINDDEISENETYKKVFENIRKNGRKYKL